MTKLRILTTIFLAVLITVSCIETSEAQKRGRSRAAVAKRHDVVVKRRVHRKVVVRRAHVRYARLPRWRAVVATVPVGAVAIRTHRIPYHFHEGIFYTPANNGFVIVRPLAGVRVKVLPPGHRRIIVGPRPYFYYYGTFYRKVDDTDEYETVDAPDGAVVDALPDGYEVKTKDGTEYYVLDDVYYAEVDAPEFEDGVGYEVVNMQ